MRAEAVPPLRRLARVALAYCTLIVAFVALLGLAYAIPNAWIIPNAGTALRILSQEGLYPYPVLEHKAYMLDNFTDALMVDTAIKSPGDNPFEAALAGRRAVDHTGRYWTITGLQRTLEGVRGAGLVYAHYWHGYQVILRPALVALSYDQIRYVNVVLLGLLGVGLSLYVLNRTDYLVAAAFLLSLLAVGVFVVPLSMQFSSVFYLMGVAVALVLHMDQQGTLPGWDVELFFVIGMLTSFFDLLTAPLLTLTMPLVLLLVMETRKAVGLTGKAAFSLVLRLSAAWTLGYVASWATKWVLATVVLGESILGRALLQFRLRSGTDGGPIAIRSALLRPIADLMPLVDVDAIPYGQSIAAVVLLVAGFTGATFVAYKRLPPASRKRVSAGLSRVWPVMLVVPLPYIWFLVANNHTSIHHWFAYRIQAPAIVAVIYFAATCASVMWAVRTPASGENRR